MDNVYKIQIISFLQTACQDQEEDEDDDEDGDQAELDSMLIECAGDLIPALAQALGGQTFAPYFAGALPLLLSRTVSIQVLLAVLRVVEWVALQGFSLVCSIINPR